VAGTPRPVGFQASGRLPPEAIPNSTPTSGGDSTVAAAALARLGDLHLRRLSLSEGGAQALATDHLAVHVMPTKRRRNAIEAFSVDFFRFEDLLTFF
jgi:hypothetical protein